MYILCLNDNKICIMFFVLHCLIFLHSFVCFRVEGNKLKIDIDNPDRAGVNASEVAQLASKYSSLCER